MSRWETRRLPATWITLAAFVLRTLVLLARVEVMLRRQTPLPVLSRRMGLLLHENGTAFSCSPRSGRRRPTAPLTWWEVDATVRRVNRVASHWPFGDTCLRRCLVIGAMLRPAEPMLMIGVRPGGEGSYQVHSWLAVAGWSIDPESSSYTPFRL